MKKENGWHVKSLGEVADFINGRAFKPEEWVTEGLPIIRIQNLTGFSSVYNYFNGDVDDKNLVRKNDILISWSASLGVYIWEGFDAVLNQHIFKVELNHGVDRTFFYYLIKTKIDEMMTNVHGSTMKHITKDRFDNIKVKLPPLPIQKRIAVILEKADEAKQKRKEANKLTDEFLQSVFIEMFGDPVKNPRGWLVTSIAGVAIKEKNAIKAGPFGSSLKKECYAEKGYKIYGQEQIIRDNLKYGDYFISKKKYEELINYAVQTGDILISLVGTFGKISIVPADHDEGIINPRLMKITLDQKIILPIFFKYYFQSYSFQQMIKNYSHGGTMDIVNIGILKSLPFILPPLPLQQQFAEIVSKTEALKEKQKQSEQELENLFQCLMQRAFKGELVS